MNSNAGDNGNGAGTSAVKASSKWGFALRRAAVVVLFAATLICCRWLAYEARFDFRIPRQYMVQLHEHWQWVTLLQLLILTLTGQFSGIYRYFSLPDIKRLALGMAASGALLYAIRLFDIGYSPPRGVVLVQVLLGFLALGGLRSLWRVICERHLSRIDRPNSRIRPVAIFGAGDAGSSLIRDLHAHPRLGLEPVAMFDDDQSKWGSLLHGVRIVGAPERVQHFQQKLQFEEVIIAMPSASPKRLTEIVALLQRAHIKHVTVPGIDQLTAGGVSISQVRPVRIDDLLGRDPVDLRLNEISGVLKGQVVMVTGAGGSIGSELCRQVASFGATKVLLVEQSEVQLFQIEQELIQLGYGGAIEPLIADILDVPRMRSILQRHRPSVLFHAAAHKHVPMMERQPGEAIKNNTLGTVLLAELALEFEVERFVMISTDKAVNPTSVMGASKRLAEVFLQAFAREHGGKTRFAAVRFGNVLGSSGSVVPIFERQIAQGGPVTVTHPDVVRYFMTIPEAVGLVLQSCAQAVGGEVYILDMGQPVKILDLARQMIRLSGLEPDRDIEIKFTGLRPGEKMFEELQHLHANCADTAHPRIKCLTRTPPEFDQVRADLSRFDEDLHSLSSEQIKGMLKQMLPEYTPHLSGQSESEGKASEQEMAIPSRSNKPAAAERPAVSM